MAGKLQGGKAARIQGPRVHRSFARSLTRSLIACPLLDRCVALVAWRSFAWRSLHGPGTLAAANAFLVSVPAERNSVLMPLVGLSYDKTITYHRWLGYWVIATTTAHMGLTWWQWADNTPSLDYLATTFASPEYTYGFVAWLCTLVMFVTALGWVRRNHFNIFFRFHYLFIAFYVLGALHAPQYVCACARWARGDRAL